MTQTLIPQNLSPFLAQRIDFLREQMQLPQQWRDVLDTMAKPQDSATAIRLVHIVQRLFYAAKLGLLENADILSAVDHPVFPLWDGYTELPATAEQQQRLAQLMYEGDIQRRAPILLNLSDYSRGIGELILDQCVAQGDEVFILISDPLFQRRIMHHCSEQQAEEFGRLMMEPYHHYVRAITLRIEQVQQPFPDPAVPAPIQQIYNQAVNDQYKATRGKFYTLSVLPTPQDAALDGILYPDYITLYFDMIGVDWTQIDAAHRILIAQLNAGKTLRLTNNDGTDVSMDIQDFTFCNSLVAKNVPGSEVFSAPRRDSVEGIVVGKGRYLFMGKLFENITLRFEKGRVVEYSAEVGQDVLTEMIETDEGSHYVGEIGIGTNPVLRTHLVNGLMVEKIGGSFHLALGNAYTFTDYIGTPVVVNNGNTSAIHEDLTFMLYGKQGCMYLDGVMIIQDGFFMDPRLTVLNGHATV